MESVVEKANWDVVVDKINSRIGKEVIMRDHDRYAIVTKCLIKVRNLKPIMIEALAALHVAESYIELGLRKIIMKGDRFQVMNAVKFTSQNLSR